jgi:hypothetical protein
MFYNKATESNEKEKHHWKIAGKEMGVKSTYIMLRGTTGRLYFFKCKSENNVMTSF